MGRLTRTKPPWRQKKPAKTDLAPFREAVNEASARSRGLWLGYIALLAYLFITVGAVTHRDLLLQSPVRLPVLNVDLPLVGFFVVAPLFFLINHFYLLLNLLGLSRRIREFNETIEASNLADVPEKEERRRLDTFVIVQMLGGLKDERKDLSGRLLRLIALITLVIAPVLLLLFIQLQFLPYQSETISWWHRIALLTDLWLLWKFWPSIKQGTWAPIPRPVLAGIGVYCLGFFACFIATFPGEYADGGPKARNWQKHTDSRGFLIKGWIFGGRILAEEFSYDTTIFQFNSGLPFLARSLILGDTNDLIDHDSFDKIRRRYRGEKDSKDIRLDPWDEQQKLWQSQRTLSLRGRSLRGAVFDRSDLRNADFEGAYLQGSSMIRTRLQGASFKDAKLQGASLDGTNMQGALLDESNLLGATINSASLLGASLHRASLQGAILLFVNLQGASLNQANLQGVSLAFANLQGAVLNSAKLQGATLYNARLQGASFRYASLQGASLDEAKLQGASLVRANLQGASLDQANLQGASLVEANLQGASLYYARLQGASLDKTSLQGSALEGANLQAASLEGALFWQVNGTPNIDKPLTTNLIYPDFSKLSAADFIPIKSAALANINGTNTRAKISTRLTQLCVVTGSCQGPLRNSIEESFWEKIAFRRDDVVYTTALAERLRQLACSVDEFGESAPYVTEGLVLVPSSFVEAPARLFDVGPIHLPGLAKYLLDAAETLDDDCIGIRGLSDEAKNQLREWAKR